MKPAYLETLIEWAEKCAAENEHSATKYPGEEGETWHLAKGNTYRVVADRIRADMALGRT